MQEQINNVSRSRDYNTTYEEVALIGNGAYGTVYKAKDLSSNRIVALKKIRIPSNSQEIGMPMSAMREIATLKQIDCFNHPNIVKLLDVCPGNRQASELQLYLVFEHIEQDLSHYIDNQPNPGIPLPRIKRILYETLCAVYFLHENRIVHRDIKPQNILITTRGQVKLADYGLSRIYSFHMALTAGVVTLWYRSPEVLLQDTYCSSVDIWSCGCIMAELFLRSIMGLPAETDWPKSISLPWSSFHATSKVPLVDIVPSLCSGGEDLMDQLLLFNQGDRITASQSLKHVYFVDREQPVESTPTRCSIATPTPGAHPSRAPLRTLQSNICGESSLKRSLSPLSNDSRKRKRTSYSRLDDTSDDSGDSGENCFQDVNSDEIYSAASEDEELDSYYSSEAESRSSTPELLARRRNSVDSFALSTSKQTVGNSFSEYLDTNDNVVKTI